MLAGRPPGRETGVDLAELPLPPAFPPAGLPSELLTRRPDLRAAALRLQASDARLAAAVAEQFPTFNLLATGGGARTVLEMGTASGIFWNLLASLAQPVFDAGRRRAEVDRADAELRESAAVYRLVVLEALQDVEDALTDNRTTETRIEGLEARVRASEANVRAATQRYLQGLSDYLPVLTAQVFLFDAQSQLLSARRQILSDRISLVRALGGNWMEPTVEARWPRPEEW